MNDGRYVARIWTFVAQCETPIEMLFSVEERHGSRLCSFVFPGNTRAQRPWFRELIETRLLLNSWIYESPVCQRSVFRGRCGDLITTSGTVA